jgi:hypothetical protein
MSQQGALAVTPHTNALDIRLRRSPSSPAHRPCGFARRRAAHRVSGVGRRALAWQRDAFRREMFAARLGRGDSRGIPHQKITISFRQLRVLWGIGGRDSVEEERSRSEAEGAEQGSSVFHVLL